jgi:hypothetical protein
MLGRMVNPVAALVTEIAVIDSELRRTSRRIVSLVRLLEPVLRRFAQLELRLERTVRQVEELTGQQVHDELYERLAGQLGVLRARAALERLSQLDPDALKDSSTDVPA